MFNDSIDTPDLPRDSFELIDLLDALYPHRCIRTGENEITAHRYAAQRALIDELKSIKQEIIDGDSPGN